MRKIILLVVFAAINVTVFKAQVKIQDRAQDRVMLLDGDVLQIRDLNQIRLKAKITLNDGTAAFSNESYITKERAKLRL